MFYACFFPSDDSTIAKSILNSSSEKFRGSKIARDRNIHFLNLSNLNKALGYKASLPAFDEMKVQY